MPRKPILAANWKENPPPPGWDDPAAPYRPTSEIDVVVFPMNGDIPACVAAGMTTGGQWGHAAMPMTRLAELGCTHVICGHSDRRIGQGETDDDVATQVHAALDVGLTPILCVGETAEERETGKAEEVVRRQMGIGDAGTGNWEIIIAYEPVWAIGTGKIPTAEDITAMHTMIRTLTGDDTRILYGGSVKPDNASFVFSCANVDGGLVGGASLKPQDFAAILASLASS